MRVCGNVTEGMNSGQRNHESNLPPPPLPPETAVVNSLILLRGRGGEDGALEVRMAFIRRALAKPKFQC